jgi:hypothetical protein
MLQPHLVKKRQISQHEDGRKELRWEKVQLAIYAHTIGMDA